MTVPAIRSDGQGRDPEDKNMSRRSQMKPLRPALKLYTGFRFLYDFIVLERALSGFMGFRRQVCCASHFLEIAGGAAGALHPKLEVPRGSW